MAKTSEHSAGEIHRRDSPLGHRAQGLERNVVRTGPVISFVPFGTEPLLVNTESKTETDAGATDTNAHEYRKTAQNPRKCMSFSDRHGPFDFLMDPCSSRSSKSSSACFGFFEGLYFVSSD